MTNLSSPAPPEFVYVFVSPANTVAMWNLKIGSFTSPVWPQLGEPGFLARYQEGQVDFLPFVPNDGFAGALSPFTMGVISGYRVELDGEVARKRWYPNAPSRLTAIHVFEHWDDCLAVHAKYGWQLSEVRRFRVTAALRSCRVNMEIISLARLTYVRGMVGEDLYEHLWRSYWGGADTCQVDLPSLDAETREAYDAGTLWEWLIDGRLDIDGSWTPPLGAPPAP